MLKFVILLSAVACALGGTVPEGLLPQLDGRIVGGSATTISSFPWQVSLQRSGSHSCGGSIYSRNVIVTAAHCLQSVSASVLQIRAGSTYWSSGGAVFAVASFKNHEGYNANTMVNDIAIIKINGALTFSSTIKSGIDTGVVTGNTSVSPGDNTDEDSAGDQWATGVTLARVLAAGKSADHGALDLASVAIGGRSAAALADDVHVDVTQLGGNGAGARGLGTPSGDGGSSAVDGVGASQRDGLDGGAEAQGGAQMEHSDVVDHGVGVVTLVVLERGNLSDDATGAPVAGSGSDLQGGGGHGLQAVSGGHNDVGRVDGSTAGVASTALQGDLPGEAADGGSSTADNAAIQLGQETLRDGASQGAGYSRQQDQELQHDAIE
ncbi:GM20439 [Drosophila sechellia]|uniref:trypsin n=1 Tax=Drosophila sechellia TaxID=7238 RepID=B4HNG3_DROSE|nr:GM20439 [Drosophila sechellia]